MKRKSTLFLAFAGIVFACGTVALTSCKHDMDDYLKPYPVTDEERVEYAQKVLGVTLDPEQDWVLTSEYSVTLMANARLNNISKVAVLDGNPYAGSSAILAYASASTDEEVRITFRAPSTAEVLYAACMTNDGKCIARAFVPGQDEKVSFVVVPGDLEESEAMTRSIDAIVDYPTYKKFRITDFFNFRNALYNNLPDGVNNTDKLVSDFGSKVRMKYNDFRFYDLPLVFLGGVGKPNFESDNDNLGYIWTTSKDGEAFVDYILMKDRFKNAFQPQYDSATKSYFLEGMYLVTLDQDKKPVTEFNPNDIVYFQMYVGEEPIDEYSGQRVKVFQMNGELFLACEDGDDWDFNDRLFWFPYGTVNLEVADETFDPVPSVPQVWTYAWEDKDFGDYDMNDCVIEVQENAGDKSKLDVTLVAVGGARKLWLGFENKKAKDYKDYIPVFNQELHEVLGMSAGTPINTGRASAEPVTITVSKPEGFDFQKCSFVLGCMFKDDQQGIYESDYYVIHIAQKGQDPHGIIIPGKWLWPTETTCIKNAYLKFTDWAHSITDPTSKNWYMTPVEGKVVK